jgi:Plasmid pRiA4b ORF-3-like protein
VRLPVWRRVVVPASFTLAELHSVLQTATGWTDSHLHSFDIGEVLYGDVEEFEGKVGNETRTRLSSVAGGCRSSDTSTTSATAGNTMC